MFLQRKFVKVLRNYQTLLFDVLCTAFGGGLIGAVFGSDFSMTDAALLVRWRVQCRPAKLTAHALPHGAGGPLCDVRSS